MTSGVRKYLVGSIVLIALIAVAGCSHYLLAEREPWRREAEAACLNSGAVHESAMRVRISAINGPGVCGMDYPLKVSALGEGGPLGYSDEALRPPSAIPSSASGAAADDWQRAPQQWPIQSNALPPAQAPSPNAAAPYPQPQSGSPQYGASSTDAPMSLTPPGVAPPDDDDADIPDETPAPYYGAPGRGPPPAPLYPSQSPPVPRDAQQAAPPAPLAPPGYEPPPLGPPSAPAATSVGPVEVKPAATLACPIVSALDRWISEAVQPAALRWFREPVVEIKQISSYSCRGMNGNPHAHISEHAFGNALDIAEFYLADGHKISVQYGWHGSPEEQGFLRDVQAAACAQFTTVLAPGANVYHYNHIHVDLMRHAGGRHICEPTAMSGEVAAARARSRYANRHGDPWTTGALPPQRPLGYAGDDDRLPVAEPGND